MILLIALLFALCLGGLAYSAAQAVQAGVAIYAGAYSTETARAFEDVFLFIPPRRMAEMGWAAAACAFLLVFLLTGSLTSTRGTVIGLLFGAAAAAVALRAPRHMLVVLKRRRLRRFNSQLADTLSSMSNALKAGFSLTQAFESVVRDGENPMAQELDVFLHETRVGVTFSEALANLERRVGSDDLSVVVSAIEAARKTGGNLTEVFEKIAFTIRERLRIEGRVRTLTAMGRLQGTIVSVMPVLIALVLMVVDPGLMRPFIHSTFGLVTMAMAALLIALGGLIVRKIVRIDV